MGLMRVLGFRRSDNGPETEGDAGGGNRLTAEHYQPAGMDAPPIEGDHAATVPAPGSGRLVAVAYADPVNVGEAAPGEVRLYSRDEGAPSAVVWLHADGSATIENESGHLTLTAAGDVEASGDINAEGSVFAGGTVEAAGDVIADKDGTAISLLNHTHIGNMGSSTSPPEP